MIHFIRLFFLFVFVVPVANALDLPPSGVKFDDAISWHQASIETDQIDIILKLPEAQWQRATDKDMTIGFVNGTFWAKVNLNVLQPSDWILTTNISTLNKLETWIIDENKFIYPLADTSGIDVPSSQYDNYRLPDLTQTVRFPNAGAYTLLFRIEQDGFLDFPAELLPTLTVLNNEVESTFGLGIYYGLFITVLIISLVYFALNLDYSFLAFSIFISGFSLFFGYIDGVLSSWIWPQLPILNTWVKHLSLPLMNAGIAWYAITFFRIPNALNWLKKVLYVELAASIILLLASGFIHFETLIYTNLCLALISIVTCLILGSLLAIKYQNTTAIPFTLAWAVFGAYLVVILLSTLNLIPITINTLIDSLKLACSVLLILLFASLALRKKKIEVAIIRANEQNRAKSNLLARVSHEIRTPINGILGLSQLLEDHLDTDEGRQYQHLIVESTESLLHIVDDLMDARQIEDGKIQLVSKPTNVAKIVVSCANLLRSQVEAKNLNLQLNIAENTNIRVFQDETRIRQVITNLINNAIKFTREGSISIALTFDRTSKLFEFKITDTGIGISSDQLERILLPFEQAANSKFKVYQGIGLGLFITNNLVELMGGTLSIESTEGQGSSFTVTLPAFDEQ